MDFAVRALVLAVVAYVGVGALLTLLQRKFQYQPGGEYRTPDQAGVPEMRPVRVTTSDGLELEGWYASAADPSKPTLAYFHGNAGNVSVRGPHLRPYLDAGLGVFIAGYRGYPNNPGKPTEQGFYRDARAALGFLDAEGIPASRIVLYGESIGTGVAVQMATEREVAAVVLNAPFTSTVDVGKKAFWMFPLKLTMRDRFDSVSKIAAIGAPLMVIHGTSDHVIPVRMGREILAAALEPKKGVFVVRAGHEILAVPAAREVLDFLNEHLE